MLEQPAVDLRVEELHAAVRAKPDLLRELQVLREDVSGPRRTSLLEEIPHPLVSLLEFCDDAELVIAEVFSTPDAATLEVHRGIKTLTVKLKPERVVTNQ